MYPFPLSEDIGIFREGPEFQIEDIIDFHAEIATHQSHLSRCQFLVLCDSENVNNVSAELAEVFLCA